MRVPEQPIREPAATRRISLNPFVLLGRISEGRYWAYYLIIPSVLLVAAVILYPVVFGINLSFQEMRLTRPDKNGFVGLEHYRDLLIGLLTMGVHPNVS